MEKLEDYMENRGTFEGPDEKLYKVEGKTTIRTKEGKAAVREAIQKLADQEAVNPLQPSEGLSKAAQAHAKDVSKSGMIDSKGSDGSTVKERLRRHGKIVKCYGESMAFLEETAEDIVIQLLISDGNAERKHRDNIFRPDFGVIGVSSQEMPTELKRITVINYAYKFLKEDDQDPIK